MYPRVKNWSYNRLTKPREVDKIIEIVNPEIVSIESNNTGKLIRPDGSNDKITFKKPAKKLEGKGKKKKIKKEESDEESDYEEPEEPRKKPAQRLLETIKNEKKEDINYSKQKKNPKKQMSEDDKKKIAELMKRLRG